MKFKHRVSGFFRRLRHWSQYRELRAMGFSKGAATWLLDSRNAMRLINGRGWDSEANEGG